MFSSSKNSESPMSERNRWFKFQLLGCEHYLFLAFLCLVLSRKFSTNLPGVQNTLLQMTRVRENTGQLLRSIKRWMIKITSLSLYLNTSETFMK